MTLQITIPDAPKGDASPFAVEFGYVMRTQVQRAAWLALGDVGADIKRDGRNEIARAGFGKRWQNAWGVNLYPPDKPSIDAALYARHKIPYAGLFQSGGVVKGRPFMWVPTDNVPVLPGRISKMTPQRFERAFGKLSGPRRSTRQRTPILFGRIPGSKKSVPMFIGIREARHRARFNIGATVSTAVSRFEIYYNRRLLETGERNLNP